MVVEVYENVSLLLTIINDRIKVTFLINGY
jgi:hypothetical protein